MKRIDSEGKEGGKGRGTSLDQGARGNGPLQVEGVGTDLSEMGRIRFGLNFHGVRGRRKGLRG